MTTAKRGAALAAGVLVALGQAGSAVGGDLKDDVAQLKKLLTEQQEKLAEHERRLAAQAKTIARQEEVISSNRLGIRAETIPLGDMSRTRATGAPETGAPSIGLSGAAPGGIQFAQAQGNQRTPVGQPPPKRKPVQPQVQSIPDIGGVLTPKGKWIIEPAIQYSHADVNRLTFRGIELLGALGIGLLSADDADRDAVIASLTGRFGISDRLEGEVKLPYVYRDDKLTNLIPQIPDANGQPAELERSLDGHGVGDLELALHYQLNAGLEGWPIFIGNLRYKSTTGKGPFDVDYDADGIEQELAMGSGFHAIEPSITALYPTDPAVLFGNLGYVFNIKKDIDKRIGDVRVGNVDPGDTFRMSFGMAYSINERTSFTLGYKNDFIMKTKTEFFNPDTGASTTQKSDTLNVGALLLGYSLALDRQTSVNLNLELGVTDDAPDVLMTLRVPFQPDL